MRCCCSHNREQQQERIAEIDSYVKFDEVRTTQAEIYSLKVRFNAPGEWFTLCNSVVSNANFLSSERVRVPVFEYFGARTSPSIRYLNIERDKH